MFKTLGIFAALYTIYAVYTGEAYIKSGVTGRTVSRGNSPEYFWVVIVIYAGLIAALIMVF
jgi:hypothetical protein